jgi:hypothetical protein
MVDFPDLRGDWKGPQKIAAGAGASNLIVNFYKREVPIIKRGQPTGATELVDYVQIAHPGESLNIIDRRVDDADKKRFAAQWAQYERGADQIPEGVPIAVLFRGHPGIMLTLQRASIFTVEQLAALSASGIESVGMGCQAWVNNAKAYLEEVSKGVDRAHFESVISELKTENQNLKAQVESLSKTVERLLLVLPEKINA